MKPVLTIDVLLQLAAIFAEVENSHNEPALYGITDGKAVGTYLEHKFKQYLGVEYAYEAGNSASGIDFPGLGVDLKVTSVTQPQSSCPFKSARQKIYGLGYHLLVFVYEKIDDHNTKMGRLTMRHTIFVHQDRAADYQTTRGITEMLAHAANADDLVAFIQDRNLPVDEIAAREMAEEILRNPPGLGYLTISNALQWRLQYGRVIQQAGEVVGIKRIR